MRWLAWSLATLFLAIIVHIAAVLSVPRMANQTLWHTLYNGLEPHSAALLSGTDARAPLDDLDPLMVIAACRYDLSAGAVSFALPVVRNYWSLAFYTPRKTMYFTLNDRTTESLENGIFAVTREEAPRFYADLPADQNPPLVIEAPDAQGIAVLRILAPTPSDAAFYRGRASEYGCAPVPAPALL